MVLLTWILDDIFRYVKSRDDKQLRNKASENDVSTCSPEDYTPNEMGHKPIVPCGLIAWSMFNDTYKLSSNDKELVINKKNIAWKSDQDGKFGSDVYPKNFQAGGLRGGAKLNESIPVSISLYLCSFFVGKIRLVYLALFSTCFLFSNIGIQN